MRIEEVPSGFSAKDMILDLAASLRIDAFEFGIEAVRREMSESRDASIRAEAVMSELPEAGSATGLYALGMSSRVLAGRTEFHLPQMDFE